MHSFIVNVGRGRLDGVVGYCVPLFKPMLFLLVSNEVLAQLAHYQ